MASVYDRFMAKTEAVCLRDWRRDLLAQLEGTVVEVGAGTGANLDLYPAAVDRVVLTEPDRHMRTILEQKVATRPAPPDLTAVDAPADALPLDDGEADAVVVTLVLCSVPDPESALEEFLRVLRPGGRLAYIEHVSAFDSPKRATWQRRLEPIWKRVAGNCHLTRRTEQAILDAGFETEEERREDMRASMPLVARTVRGSALAPDAPGSAG
jgi:ubiquinone/menaquinone biosynthesis C-methylase UbiE